MENEMPKQVAATSILKAVLAGLALASLATAVLLHAAKPADAKPKKDQSCGDKLAACTSRCIRRYETTEEAFRCVTRTCEHQFDACVAGNGGGGSSSGRLGMPKPATGVKVAVPPRPRIGRVGPLSGGILDPTQGVPSQGGPAATGSPRAPTAPSAPPVIIR
jgi:hypothetical protein